LIAIGLGSVVVVAIVAFALLPSEDTPRGLSAGKVDTARQAEVIHQMNEDMRNAKQARVGPPPEEVRRQLVGAWRIDAKYREGEWKPWRKAGKSQDVEFRADGTVQKYFLTFDLDGRYEARDGDGCIDLLITIGEQPYNYACSATFEDGNLLMTGWERTEGRPQRIINSVEDGRTKGSLDRFYRVKTFRGDE
jgi:hypothetical protein